MPDIAAQMLAAWKQVDADLDPGFERAGRDLVNSLHNETDDQEWGAVSRQHLGLVRVAASLHLIRPAASKEEFTARLNAMIIFFHDLFCDEPNSSPPFLQFSPEEAGQHCHLYVERLRGNPNP